MKLRCCNPKATDYDRYGGRGITVCERWLSSFDAFLADMGPRPSPRHSIDRIDGNGNYEPGNCRWADGKTQNRNKSNARRVSIPGSPTIAELAEKAGLRVNMVAARLARGWDLGRALAEPPRPRSFAQEVGR